MYKKLPEIYNHGGTDLKLNVAAYKKLGIKINPLVWDVLYLYLADYLSVINLCCGDYLKIQQPVCAKGVEKLQKYHQKSSHIVEAILFPDRIKDVEPQLLKIKEEARKLDSKLKSDISHYVNNALHKMGFIIMDAADSKFPSPISIEHTQKIYDISSQIITVLEYIRIELQEQNVGF